MPDLARLAAPSRKELYQHRDWFESHILDEWHQETVSRILTMARDFIAETGYTVTFDWEKAHNDLWDFYHQPKTAIVYATDHLGNIGAAALVSRDSFMQNEEFGYVMKFYTSAAHRGTGLAQNLRDHLVLWFERCGCVASFATDTALIGAGQSFRNLFEKAGYRPSGATLWRTHG